MVQQQPSVTHLPSRLSTKLKDFIDNHGVNIDMSCMYTSSAMTLQRDPNKMVLVQYQALSRDEHMSYQSLFEAPPKAELPNQSATGALIAEIKEEPQKKPDKKWQANLPTKGPKITLVEFDPKKENLKVCGMRPYAEEYRLSEPYFSPDQSCMVLHRKSNLGIMVDIFNITSDTFFESETTINQESPELVQSCFFPGKVFAGKEDFAPQIRISQSCKYLAAFNFSAIYLYQLDDQGSVVRSADSLVTDEDFSDISQEDGNKTIQGLDQQRQPVLKVRFNLKNQSYSKIFDVQINEKELSRSWAVISCDIFQTLHFLPLGAIVPQLNSSIYRESQKLLQQQQNEINLVSETNLQTKKTKLDLIRQHTTGLSSNNFSEDFYPATDDIKVYVRNLSELNLQNQVAVRFTSSGKNAVIHTQNDLILVNVDLTSPESYKSLLRLPFKQDQRVKTFDMKDDTLLFSQQDPDELILKLSCIQEIASDTKLVTPQLQIDKDFDVVEISEIQRNEQGRFMRVLGICDNQELHFVEIKEDSGEGNHTVRLSFNSVDQTALEWPFFAYSLTPTQIVIKHFGWQAISHVIDFQTESEEEDQAMISKLFFESSGNLYVQMVSENEIIFYCVECTIDFNLRHKKLLQVDKRISSFQRARVMASKDFSKLEEDVNSIDSMKSISNFKVYQEILRTPNSRPINQLNQDFYPIEFKEGFETHYAFLVHQNKQIQLIQSSSFNISHITNVEGSAERLIKATSSQFYIFDKEQQEIRRLQILCQGGLFVIKQTTVHKEYNARMERVVVSADKLYMLLYSKPEYSLKVFSLSTQQDHLEFTYGKNHIREALFVAAFKKAPFLTSGILLVDSEKFYKIYEDFDGTQECIIQEYQKYLPMSKQGFNSRKLLLNQLKVSFNDRKIALTFAYAGIGRAKKVSIMPFFSDNKIKLVGSGQRASWISEETAEVSRLENESASKYVSAANHSAQEQSVNHNLKMNQNRIFTLDPEVWQLTEFDMAGLKVKESQFEREMSQYQIMCVALTKPLYLVTPRGANYINLIRLAQITEDHSIEFIADIYLHKVKYNDIEAGFFAKLFRRNRESVMDALQLYRNIYGCEVRFQINNEGDIVIASVLPSGFIVQMFVIKLNSEEQINGQPQAYQVFARLDENIDNDDIGREARNSEIMRGLQIRDAKRQQDQPLLDPNQQENMQMNEQNNNVELEQRAYSLGYVTDFQITGRKLLIWNQTLIFHGDIKKEKISGNYVKLKICQLQVAKRQDGLLIGDRIIDADRLLTPNFGKQIQNEIMHNFLGRKDDFIDQVVCRDLSIQTPNGKEQVTVQLKIMTGEKSHIVSYNVDADKEVCWMQASRESTLGFSGRGECLLFDPNLGLIELHQKRNLLEYHFLERQLMPLAGTRLGSGVSWGSRLKPTLQGTFLIFSDELVLPFSYLNILQHFRPKAEEGKQPNYFVEDFYKIQGNTPLHKLIYEPLQLEKMLDCYSKQNPLYLSSVLIKQELTQLQMSGSQKDQKDSKTTNAKNLNKEQKRTRETTSLRFKSFVDSDQYEEEQESDWTKEIHYGADVLDAQLEMGSDQLVNKLLNYLTQVPQQLIFQSLYPRFSELVKFASFAHFFDLWFEKTQQMVQTNVLFTSLPQGTHKIMTDFSYLDRKFFDKYPANRIRQLSSFRAYEHFKNANMKQVNLKVLEVSWILTNEQSFQFFQALCWEGNHGDPLEFFQNQNLRLLVDFMWENARPYFIFYRFTFYLFWVYVPVLILSNTNLGDQDQSEPVLILQMVCIGMIALNCVIKILSQINDLFVLGLHGYITSFNSIFDLLLISILGIFVWYSSICVLDEIENIYDENHSNNMRIVFIAAIIMVNIQLARSLKFFDFFASFIRSIIEVTKASIQIAAMSGFIIVTFAILFQILDQNNPDQEYIGGYGYLLALFDSYSFAIGDFSGIQQNFKDFTGLDLYTYWLLFFVFSLGSLIVILNIVIAVMSFTIQEVHDRNDAYCYREKVLDIMDNIHRFPSWIRKRFEKHKYMIIVDIDPPLNLSSENSQGETQIIKRLDIIADKFQNLQVEQSRIKSNLDSLHQKLGLSQAVEKIKGPSLKRMGNFGEKEPQNKENMEDEVTYENIESHSISRDNSYVNQGTFLSQS